MNKKTWIENYAELRSNSDSEFKAGYEEEKAVLALVRARNAALITQTQIAKTLEVSQPYIAQIERGTKPMSLSLMVRYANAVGLKIALEAVHGDVVTTNSV